MKYVSLDLETTSLQPSPNNILMVSMVVEDSEHPEVPVEELPHFTCFVKPPEPISGQLFALSMNGWILDIISGRTTQDKYPIYQVPSLNSATNWQDRAKVFLLTHFGDTKATVAGKNVAGFDMQFLPPDLKALFNHQVLDPGSLYVNWKTDKKVPGLLECKKRADINTPVAHDAYLDALDVIRVFRRFYDK